MEHPKERRYTTLSISKKIKEELDEIMYSSGKRQNYDELLRDLILMKKAKMRVEMRKQVLSESKQEQRS